MYRSLLRPWQALPWLLASSVILLLAVAPPASAQSPSCSVGVTWPNWTGGNGFGAELRITNHGPAINGWQLVFNMPNGQRLQNGWPVLFTQPAGSATVTVASNAEWNQSIATNGTFTVGFNGTHPGTNNPPTGYTLNGTACTGPVGGNTAPVVTLTAPSAGQSFPAGTTSVTLSATATDNVSVQRVEFRLNGTLVNTDTSSPYSFTATGLTAGTHTGVPRRMTPAHRC